MTLHQWLDAASSGAAHLFSGPTLIAFAIMLPISLMSGLMPGGGLPVAVLVLSFAAFLNPWVAAPVLLFYQSAHDVTAAVPSILIGVPGSRASQATILDGYPLTRQGQAGRALGAAFGASIIGCLVGAVALIVAIPVSTGILKYFSSPEFFLLSAIGVFAVAVVSSGAMLKGLLGGCFAFTIAFIGIAPVGGSLRETMGLSYLWNGISLGPLVIGLFAIPELVSLVIANRETSARATVTLAGARRSVYAGMREALHHRWLVVRSSLIGTVVGMLPGIGGSGAHWIAYSQARHTEKGARTTFGTGDVRGVMAAEGATNASDGGELIPTLLLGIPGSGGKAFLLAILLLSGGIGAGPSMISDHLDLTIGLFYTIVLANLAVVAAMVAGIPLLVKAAAIRGEVFAPVVIGIVTLAAILATNTIGDLVMVAVFAVLGLLMKFSGWPRPPVLIAVVLADPIERYLSISLQAYTPEQMVLRPAFLSILGVVIVLIAVGVRQAIRAKAATMQMSAAQARPEVSLTTEAGAKQS